jgi:hypothetical protein
MQASSCTNASTDESPHPAVVIGGELFLCRISSSFLFKVSRFVFYRWLSDGCCNVSGQAKFSRHHVAGWNAVEGSSLASDRSVDGHAHHWAVIAPCKMQRQNRMNDKLISNIPHLSYGTMFVHQLQYQHWFNLDSCLPHCSLITWLTPAKNFKLFMD